MRVFPLTPIGELVEPVSSWVPDRVDPGGAFTYIDLSAVDQETKTITGIRAVPCQEAPSRARQLVRKGDVLVSTVRPNLNGVARVTSELDGATASTGFCVLRSKKSVLNHDYLFQWVKTSHFISDMIRKATGASYPAVSDRIVWESKIPLPQPSEQRRIAAILNKADALRVQRRTAIAQLDALTQSIFLDMFGDPASKSRGFATERLGALALNITDGKHGDCRPAADSGYYFISVKDIKSGYIDYSEARQIEREDFLEVHKRTKLALGDVLITNSGTIGKTAIVTARPELERTTFQKSVAIIKPRKDRLDSTFLRAVLENSVARLCRASSGSSQKNLLLSQLREIPICLPPLELQQEFALRIAAVANQKKSHCLSLKELNTLFASLQHRAFCGEL